MSMLSSHLLGPLFLEYEQHIKQLEREVSLKDLEVQRQSDTISQIVHENQEMATRLDIQQREYLKLVEGDAELGNIK